MQSPFLHLCRTFSSTRTLLNPPPPPPLGFRHSLSAHNRSLLPPPSLPLGSPRPGPVRPRNGHQGRRGGGGGGGKQRVSVRGKKDNVWSIDNDVARAASEKERSRPRASRKRGRRVVRGKRGRDGKVMVSAAMLMEVETVLQTQVWFVSLPSCIDCFCVCVCEREGPFFFLAFNYRSWGV